MSPTIRALRGDEAAAVTAARLIAVESAPYLAHAIFAMRPVAADGLGTLAVDRFWRLYIDPTTAAEWGPRLTGGVLVHEVSHLLRDHASRADALGHDRDHTTWNFATDAAINDDLTEASITLPDGVVTPEALALAPNGIEEAYYAQLRNDDRFSGRNPDTSDAENATADGCGSGAGDPIASWELPTDHGEAPALPQSDAEVIRRVTAEAITQHVQGQGRGTVPGGWQRWAHETLSPPTISWRHVFGSTVRRAVAWRRGCVDYSYARPGRRRIPHVVTPSMRRPEPTVAVVIDTSASMNTDQLTAAVAEVTGVVRAVGTHGITVLTCDAAVSTAMRVRRAEDVQLTGGGGTDMRVAIDAAEALRPTPDVLIVLTDGGTPWPDQPTRARLIIGLTSPVEASTPEWATAITIPVEP